VHHVKSKYDILITNAHMAPQLLTMAFAPDSMMMGLAVMEECGSEYMNVVAAL
jgi:hypothetical protein